jgi:hypothetical protein
MNLVPKLLVVAVFLAGPAALAAPVQKPQITVELPDGWVEVPASVLQRFYDEMQRQAPNAKIPKYDYAFQAKAGPPWLDYPYVLVKVTPSGRPTESELESLPALNLNDKFEAKKGDWAAVMTDTTLGQMRYDKAANVVWLSSKSNVVNVGSVSGISGVIPTEQGFVELHGYAQTGDFAGYFPTFQRIITGAKVSPVLLYQPRWSDKLGPAAGLFDFNRLGAKVALGAVIGILLAVFFTWRRKRD